ncbi:MAG: sunS 1 [Acidobacteria bacterium]|jgi:GT2 family glycosyltransferase|nr:sunS 1 [Acidobacteriota bacterium]
MQKGSQQGAADIIIPVRNCYAETRALLESIYRHTDYQFHIYVIDDASTDETVDLAKIYTRDITILRNRVSRGRSSALNKGIQAGSNPYLVFLDNGIELAQGWLESMVAFLDTHPRIAAVGPLRSGSQGWQSVERVRARLVPEIPCFFTRDTQERNRILQYHFHRTGILIDGTLSFSCSVFARRAVEEVGPVLESDAGRADADYCRRLRRAGYVLGLALDVYVACRNGASEEVRCHIARPKARSEAVRVRPARLGVRR